MLQLVPGTGVRPPRFKDLRVRPKLIVLHNAFFFILACAVYYAVIPLVEEYVTTSRQREAMLLGEAFLQQRDALPSGDVRAEDRAFGDAATLEVPPRVRLWLESHPGALRLDPAEPHFVYSYDPNAAEFGRLRLDAASYDAIVTRARVSLFVALGAIYLLAVAALELVVMPRYVYRPIRAHLEADQAVQDDDRDAEMIPQTVIPGDEIGDIMRSRNAAVRNVRDNEARLQSALARQRELSEDLRAKNDELENAKRGMAAQDRLATIGLLSSSVAHELNTPLAVIAGTIEKLLETVEDRVSRRRLERVGRMNDRLRRISEGLLDFSRVRRNEERTAVNVRALLDEAWSLVAFDKDAAQVAFDNRTPPDAHVLGDYDRLMQVFVNLLRNGVKAVAGPGRVAADARPQTVRGRKRYSITIDDTGPGIPEEMLPNIFEAFVSNRLDSEGTGLGLTVADGIVQRHGGEIRASNRPEGGARLEVDLPAASQEAIAGRATIEQGQAR